MDVMHGGQIVARALQREGVSHLFTLCGGHVQAIYDGCLDEGIRVVDFRHEQAAAHAADGWARVTGEVGVAVVTAGPGVTGTVTALANAYRAQIPMVVIGGQGPASFMEMGSLQEMDHVSLVKSVTKWAASVRDTRRLAEYLSMAFRAATTGVPGPVFLEVPLDVLVDSAPCSEVAFPDGYRTRAGTAGDPSYVKKALELIAGAERPVILVGSQLRFSVAPDSLQAFAERFQIPAFLSGMARGALPPSHPCAFSRSRSKALAEADLILIFGTPLDFRLGYGRAPRMNGGAWLVQVDLDGREIGRNRGVHIGIVGDSGLVMSQLVEAAGTGQSERTSLWLERLQKEELSKEAEMALEWDSSASPVNPLRLCRELERFVDNDTYVVGDGGDFVATGANIVRTRAPFHWMDPGPLGTLGVGAPYAMAARLARPTSRVLVLFGDGSFGFNGMEYEAAARQNIPFVGVIGNDAAWTQIRRGQVMLYGESRAVATKLGYTRYDAMVDALGGYGQWVERAEDIAPALERAFRSGKPALVNVKMGSSDFRKQAISV